MIHYNHKKVYRATVTDTIIGVLTLIIIGYVLYMLANVDFEEPSREDIICNKVHEEVEYIQDNNLTKELKIWYSHLKPINYYCNIGVNNEKAE